jgi:hypothetical protein
VGLSLPGREPTVHLDERRRRRLPVAVGPVTPETERDEFRAVADRGVLRRPAQAVTARGPAPSPRRSSQCVVVTQHQ